MSKLIDLKKITLIAFILLNCSCTSKYVIYPTIDKHSFADQNTPQNTITHNPTTPKLLPAKKINHEACFDQWLFMNNADKETDQYLPNYFRHICKESNFLVNTKITRTWWTLLIYSQSCVEINGFCGRPLSLKK